MNQIQYEPLKPKTVLNPVRSPAMPFDWSINPYRGCQHGCSFCYARSTHSFLGLETDDTSLPYPEEVKIFIFLCVVLNDQCLNFSMLTLIFRFD